MKGQEHNDYMENNCIGCMVQEQGELIHKYNRSYAVQIEENQWFWLDLTMIQNVMIGPRHLAIPGDVVWC